MTFAIAKVIYCVAADIFWHFMDRAEEGVRNHNYYLNVCDFAILAVPDHDVSQAISDRTGLSIPAWRAVTQYEVFSIVPISYCIWPVLIISSVGWRYFWHNISLCFICSKCMWLLLNFNHCLIIGLDSMTTQGSDAFNTSKRCMNRAEFILGVVRKLIEVITKPDISCLSIRPDPLTCLS